MFWKIVRANIKAFFNLFSVHTMTKIKCNIVVQMKLQYPGYFEKGK